ESVHLFRSFPRKRESRAKDWVPAFAGTNGWCARPEGATRSPFACAMNARQPPKAEPRPLLFSRPGFGAGEGCCCADYASFELQCRLKPGPGHFQQDLAVPFRSGLAGPTQTLLRELTEVFGRCSHGALRTKNRRERDRSLSHRRLRASRCR